MKTLKALWFGMTSVLLLPSIGMGQWNPHVVRLLNGTAGEIKTSAQMQALVDKQHDQLNVPYLVYMPEKNRLLLLAAWGGPAHTMVMTSDDLGATWGAPHYVHTDSKGAPDVGLGVSLTYLGAGKVLFVSGDGKAYWLSEDYGENWRLQGDLPPAAEGKTFNVWDPFFVDRAPGTGVINRLIETGYMSEPPGPEGAWGSQGTIRVSSDEGKTWSAAVRVPQWAGYNEIELIRAKNGDLVAACRSDGPERFKKLSFDHYCGLGVSISKDNGESWSKVSMLYDWGRHHPSLALLPSGDIVMTYVVRRGYRDAPDGLRQFGVEAIVSHDNGETWDLDHRYLLAAWKSLIQSSAYWYCSPQATSTVLLPDGSLITVFGSGTRTLVNPAHFGQPIHRDVGVVRWRVSDSPVNSERTITNAPFDSDLRNKFDPDPAKAGGAILADGKKNVAVVEEHARIGASSSDQKPEYILYDGYSDPVTTLLTIPAWVEISWPKAHRIDEIRIFPGAPALPAVMTECVPQEYRLQYRKGGKWIDLVPPVTQTMRYKEFKKTAKDDGAIDSYISFQYVHKFAPVSVKAVRMDIQRSTDTGKRPGHGDEIVVPENKRETVLRRIEILEPAK